MSDPSLKPDPSVIGGIAVAPFVRPLDPVAEFRKRADRFAFLAQTSDLGPFLDFLAALTGVQAQIAERLPAPEPLPAEELTRARQAAMPPIDRLSLIDSPELAETLEATLTALREVEMPDQARVALEAVIEADTDARRWLIANVMAETIPEEAAAPLLLVAIGVQVHLSRLAATLDGTALVPIRTGVCPACGGRPNISTVVGTPGAENTRYAHCASCATAWNEVRVKCLCCGSTKGIGYRTLDEGGKAEKASVRAEVCDECHRWVKILYQTLNPTLDPVADDVASLGLDIALQDSEWRRGAFNPLLSGF